MIIPVRCFTCGKVVGDKYELYIQMLTDGTTEVYFFLLCLTFFAIFSLWRQSAATPCTTSA